MHHDCHHLTVSVLNFRSRTHTRTHTTVTTTTTSNCTQGMSRCRPSISIEHHIQAFFLQLTRIVRASSLAQQKLPQLSSPRQTWLSCSSRRRVYKLDISSVRPIRTSTDDVTASFSVDKGDIHKASDLVLFTAASPPETCGLISQADINYYIVLVLQGGGGRGGG